MEYRLWLDSIGQFLHNILSAIAWPLDEPLALSRLLDGKHPRDAIIRAWQIVEENVLEVATLYTEAEGKPEYWVDRTVPQALGYLQYRSDSRVSQSTRDLVIALIELRGDVVRYSFTVSRAVAEAYLRAVQSLIFSALNPLVKAGMWAVWAAKHHKQQGAGDS